jgi:hypothetical protein
MPTWFTETGFGYVLGVAAVTLVGLLLYRGLWGDRTKGRARCPKYWYDMRGTLPRPEFPECGYDTRSERRLHKTHRRRGRIVVGAVLVLLSAYPLVIRRGGRHVDRPTAGRLGPVGRQKQRQSKWSSATATYGRMMSAIDSTHLNR